MARTSSSLGFFQPVLFVLVFLATPLPAWSQSAAPAPDDETLRWIDVLTTDQSVYDQAMACRRLARVGDDRAIPALEKLLHHTQLATYARSALEGIASEASDQALRQAAKKLSGDLLIGTLTSLGRRRDAEASQLLVSLLGDDDRRVAAAAARALGAVGHPSAVEPLQGILDGSPAELRSTVAFACLNCADNLKRAGDLRSAIALYLAVRQADLPSHIKLSATRLEAVALGEKGQGLLSSLLHDPEPEAFDFGLQAARDLGILASNALVEAFERSDGQRQVLLLQVIADVDTRGTLPTVLAAAKNKDPTVRAQSMRTLTAFEPSQVASTLFMGIEDPDETVAHASRTSLMQVPGEEINRELTKRLTTTPPKDLPTVIELVGQRKLPQSTPTLFGLVLHDNSDVRSSAVHALGTTVTLAELPRLLELAMEPPAGIEKEATNALAVACARLPQEKCATVLSAAISNASLPMQTMLLEQLRSIGGRTALETIVSAAKANVDELQDTATRLLGTWPTRDAMSDLLELSTTLTSARYRVRVLRGYIRIARQSEMSLPERIDVCRRAFAAADRLDEKKLVLELLVRYPSLSGLSLAESQLKDPSLQAAALSTLLSIAPSLVDTDPEQVADALTRMLGQSLDDDQRAKTQELLVAAEEARTQMMSEDGFRPLFDGKTFEGWHGNTNIFRVEDNQIVGGSLKEPVERNEFLRSNAKYSDFELRLEFKLLGSRPNAGVQIRTQEIPDHHEVSGYQADLGPGLWGCLYDESRRNRVLAGPSKDELGRLVRSNQWNDYRIRCEGHRIRLWVNGKMTVDYTEEDANIPFSGIIAVQVHAGQPMEARYRHLRIKELDRR